MRIQVHLFIYIICSGCPGQRVVVVWELSYFWNLPVNSIHLICDSLNWLVMKGREIHFFYFMRLQTKTKKQNVVVVYLCTLPISLYQTRAPLLYR